MSCFSYAVLFQKKIQDGDKEGGGQKISFGDVIFGRPLVSLSYTLSLCIFCIFTYVIFFFYVQVCARVCECVGVVVCGCVWMGECVSLCACLWVPE